MITIRSEQPPDYDAIDEVNRLAFGQEDEVRLVRGIRRLNDFDPRLSLVALQNRQIVGHVMFSPIDIEAPDRSTCALALAPMSVRPASQRKGVGVALVHAGLRAGRDLGHTIVVVVGHPGYYPRFGFIPARKEGLDAPFPVPDEAFMVLELSAGALAGVTGTVKYPPPFDGIQ